MKKGALRYLIVLTEFKTIQEFTERKYFQISVCHYELGQINKFFTTREISTTTEF